MSNEHHRIVLAWRNVIVHVIALGEDEAAAHLAAGLVRRLRELGYPV
jgi:hypothetical protein